MDIEKTKINWVAVTVGLIIIVSFIVWWGYSKQPIYEEDNIAIYSYLMSYDVVVGDMYPTIYTVDKASHKIFSVKYFGEYGSSDITITEQDSIYIMDIIKKIE